MVTSLLNSGLAILDSEAFRVDSVWGCCFYCSLLHVELKEQIKLAQSHYQVLADSKHSSAPEFTIGSHVFLKVVIT